ncbi:MAG: RluA family pseudouridine synthase [Fervidobacterium sp.]|uniref:RluA family pseudouridine synthase n=1 Tax=Fervidobacterium sp. TaxID=1871331 RepID=UPI0040491D03
MIDGGESKTDNAKSVIFVVDESNYFSRIDKFLRNALKNVPLSALYKFLRTGKVYINGKKVKEPSEKIEIGDRVEIRDEDVEKYSRDVKELRPVKMKLNILFEDEELIVLNKPAGVSVHPGKAVNKPSLIEGLKHYGEKNGFEPFLVHRLDKDTSGVLIVAKNRQAARELSELISSRDVEKIYTALVFGTVKPQKITLPVDGQEAISNVKPIKRFKSKISGKSQELTLLRVEIETGRKHQIRKHLAGIGAPIVCDNDYGDFRMNREFEKKYSLKRHFLHCSRMVFSFRGRHYDFEAELGEDLKLVLKLLEAENVQSSKR